MSEVHECSLIESREALAKCKPVNSFARAKRVSVRNISTDGLFY